MKSFIPSPKEHIFFSSMTIILVVLILAGFSNTYLPKMGDTGIHLPRIVHFHSFVFVLWLGFFLYQVLLNIRKKIELHRRLGNWGVLFSMLMLVVGFATSIEVAKLGHKGIPGVEFPDSGGFLLLNLCSLLVFVSLTILGWLNRNNASTHKRFMLMANAGGLTPPGIARLPFIAGSTPAIALVVLGLILAGPVFDIIRYRKIHWAYLLSILIIIISLPPVVLALSKSTIWKVIAESLVQL